MTLRSTGAWHRRLHVRQALTLAGVALGSAAVVGVPLYLLALGLVEEGLHDRLEGIAELAAIALTGPNGQGDSASAVLETVRVEADLDAVCLLERQGKAVRSAAGDPRACELNPAEMAVVASLGSSDSAHTDVETSADGTSYLFAFAPLIAPAAHADVVAVRASAPYLQRLDAFRNVFAAAGVAGVLLVGLLGAWSAKRLVRPVEELVAATGRLGEGNEPEPQKPAGTVELEQLQEAFTGMSVLVRAREKSLRALAGSVAHEVRNPAHALRLHLGLLRRELGSGSSGGSGGSGSSGGSEPARDRIDTLQALLDELDATVEAFLLFARDRAPRRKSVNLRALLSGAAPGAEVQAADVEVSVDPLLVSRAVSNLVHNALQAGSDRVLIRATAGDALIIEVEDRGPGFSEALLSTAFEPFVAGRQDGTGLGLAIALSVAQAHGGGARISRSAPGCTIVELRLPLATGA